MGQIFADLGADVIKLEPPAGDDTRQWGPPFVVHGGQRNAAYFHCCNRGKRSVVADIKTKEGRQLALALAARADVLIENHKAGGLKKYGLHYAAVAAKNPGVVYCSISGFGQTGPAAARAGYDFLAQGMGGMMSLTGEPTGAPQKIGVAMADILTGIYGVVGAQAALARRAQNGGRGEHIDLSLLDSMVGVLANQAQNHFAGAKPRRMGNQHPNIAPYQALQLADGHVILAVGNNGQFAALCKALKSNWAQEARFASNGARVQNREALSALLRKALARRRKAAFLRAMQAAGVPAAPIYGIDEVFADEQTRHRKMKIAPQGVAGVRTPLVFSRSRLALRRASPLLGAHNKSAPRRWGVKP